jgi:phage host-nuclease inhibitor protein Gam
MIDWYDLDDELRDFITLMAEKYSINLEEVKKLVRLIFEYGFRCYCEGHRDSEAEEAMFGD